MINTLEEPEKKEAKYSVYMHTNKTNGKVYVGVTRVDPKKRWRNGEGYRGQKLFFYAIKKYGWKNFKHEIIYSEITRQEAGEREKELIAFYKSNCQEYGYNADRGGFDFDPSKHQRMTRAKGKYKRPIVLFSTRSHKELYFIDVKEAAGFTKLSEEYILDCCDKLIINNTYCFDYHNHRVGMESWHINV